MLNPEIVTVVAGGMVYTGWEKVTVTAGIKQAAREFTLETTERPGAWNFPPGTPAQVLSNGDLLAAGFVNDYSGHVEAKSHRITIRGRSKSQDLVDSSAEHETGYWENKDPEEIGRDLDRHGVGVKAEVPLDKIPYWQLAPGETVFRTLERSLRPQGASMMGTPEGDIRITNASVARSAFGILMEGLNIKSAQFSISDHNRHSKYIVRGQRRHGRDAASLRVRGYSSDSGGKRKRTKILINETDTDQHRADKRAEHERDAAAGNSIRCSIQTQGFRDMAGRLFEPNTIIWVHAPILMHLTMGMLIESLRFSQDDKSGSITELQLVDPRAHKGKGGGGAQGPGMGDVTGDASAGAGETDPAWMEGYR